MSGAVQPPGTIGQIAKPQFAVPPNPAELFRRRADRLAALSAQSALAPYLRFLAHVSDGQHAIQVGLPAANPPSADGAAAARTHGMPAFSHALLKPDEIVDETLDRLVRWLPDGPLPKTAVEATESLRTAATDRRRAWTLAVLQDADSSPSDIPRTGIIAAALQLHFARLAASLDPESLTHVADAACPVCGSAPMTSAVVGWPNAFNTRYCACSLCGTLWNVVRVKCLYCGATDGITYRMIEEQPETIKAESCNSCQSYIKVLYQTADPELDPFADDVASLSLDILMRQNNWRRRGQNVFLAGY